MFVQSCLESVIIDSALSMLLRVLTYNDSDPFVLVKAGVALEHR